MTAPPSDRATRPSAQAPSGLGDTASIAGADRIQRWFRRFDSAPRDGTPFAVTNIIRRNPYADHWEALYLNPETGEREWHGFEWPPENEPAWWCRLPPLRFELPNKSWFAMAYEIEVMEAVSKTFLARCFSRFQRKVNQR